MAERPKGHTVLVVDGGGRGAVLAHKYAQSPHVGRVLAVPGNDLMKINTSKPVEIFPQLKTTSVNEVVQIVADEGVDLVDVAQDNAVEAGMVDEVRRLTKAKVVGPTAAAGRIESDKGEAREKGARWELPQPAFKVFASEEDGIEFLKSQSDRPWYVKASGLAEGKGALPAENNNEAMGRIAEMKRFKEAGEVYVIEEWIKGDDGSEGEEFSAFAIGVGEEFEVIGYAQDNKKVNNNDEGPNTGGMGCTTPPLFLSKDLTKAVKKDVFKKAFEGQVAEGHPYSGVLYLGGMAVKRDGVEKPYVVEWNARWGDPEAQILVPGLNTDLFELGMAIADGDISGVDISTDGKARVVVAGASRGYPDDYSGAKGKEIFGLFDVVGMDGVTLYTAGVKEEDGRHYASGGRLFYVVGEGENVIEARAKAYEGMSRVFVEGNNLHYRTDIGWRDVQRLHTA